MDIKINGNTIIVFDLDDTLYNEIDYLKSAYIHIAKEIDPQNWQLLFAKMFSLYRHKKDVFEMLVRKYDCKKERIIELYRNHSPNIEPFKGVIELLKDIKGKKGKIGIITDGRKKTQMAKLTALGIHEFLDKIVISEELGTEKPDKKNYLTIERAFSGHTYFYIADNIRKDFIAPNKLGWQTIGLIDNGLNIHHDTYKFSSKTYIPQNFIMNIQEIRIV